MESPFDLTEEEAEKIREAKREYHRGYYARNKERIQEKNRKWRAENPDKVRKSNQEYWLKQAGQGGR